MEEDKKTSLLLEKLNMLTEAHSNAKTAFLDKPEVKKALIEKFKKGIRLKDILSAIQESGFKISMATLRKWKKDNFGVREKKVKRK